MVNQECPVFVLCEPSLSGLGDKLEHYVYTMNLAKMYLATVIVDAQDFIKEDKHTHHEGVSEYHTIARDLLGINMNHNMTFLQREYPRLKKRGRTFPDALDHLRRIKDTYQEGMGILLNVFYGSFFVCLLILAHFKVLIFLLRFPLNKT